jgi:RNA polymerase sigma factor (sigma-70 family)
MAKLQLDPLLGHICKLIAPEIAETQSDQELLNVFAVTCSEVAFAELVRRHSSLVLTVCRQVLRDAHHAEDAFQATFLVLARKAASVRKGTSLASWLYGVAFRISMKARNQGARRRSREAGVPPRSPLDPVTEAALRELQTFLHEEVNRLPEKLRAPFVLCCLEGKSRTEAAQRLGWKEGTVAGRLALARERLWQCLARRGVAPSAALAAVCIDESSAAAFPTAMPAATARAILLLMADKSAAIAGTSARAAALAEAAIQGPATAKIKAGVVLLLIILTAAGTTALAWQAQLQEREIGPAPYQNQAELAHDQPKVAPKDRFGDLLPIDARMRLGTTRFRVGGLVYCCAYSPDGTILAAGSGDNTVRLFEAATGQPLRECQSHQSEATCLAFSRNGRTLASGDGHGRIVTWDPTTGKMLRTIYTEQRSIWALAFTRDGEGLLAGGEDNTLLLWNVATGEELRRFEGHSGPVRSVAVSPDGKFAVSGGRDATVQLWDVETGKSIRGFTGHAQPKKADFHVGPVAFSPDGKWVASPEGTNVCVWETVSGDLVCRLPHVSYAINTLAFAPDGKTVATGAQGHDLLLWDVPAAKMRQKREGRQTNTYSGRHWGGVACVAFSPDAKALAFGEDHCLAIWDTVSGKLSSPTGMPAGSIRRVIFTANGKALLTATEDHAPAALMEWDLVTGRPRQALPDNGRAYSITLSPDASIVAAGSGKILRLWDARSGKEQRQIALPADDDFATLPALAFSPDGQHLAGGGSFVDGSIRVWETATGKEVSRLQGHGPWISGLAFSPDGKFLASCGNEHDIRVHDLASGKTLLQFKSPGGRAYYVSFSPDGKMLASTGPRAIREFGSVTDATVLRLWDIKSGKMLHQLEPIPATSWLASPIFSPDSRMIAASNDRSVRLWEVATGKERRAFAGHTGAILDLAFSPDGRTMASGSADSTVLLWDIYGSGWQERP